MAQDDLDFQSILEELRKADEIEKQNAQIQEELDEHSESINALEDQTSELLEAAGLEEDDKERNVIGKDKLTATLSSSEKKRYQNIGKEFIEGAGKEFQRILKASKFKNMMSTVKEKFSAGIAKMKRAIKKAKQSTGFLGKLLVVIGLLGAIFYLFKDKITQALPNISNFVKDIFQKAKDFLGGLVEKSFSIFTGGSILGSGLSVVVGYFKDAVEIFFNQTLPDAIYEMYLNVLSMFSSDAEDIRQEMENHPANEQLRSQATDIADQGQEEAESGASIEDAITASSRVVDQASSDLSRMNQTQLTELQAATSNARFSGLDQNSPLVKQLNDLAEGDEDIIKMINDGQIDTRSLFDQIRQASQDGELSRQEAFAALQNSVQDEAIRERMRIREVAETIRTSNPHTPDVIIDGQGVLNQAGRSIDDINRTVQAQNQSQSSALTALTEAAAADGRRHAEITAQMNANNQRSQSQRNNNGAIRVGSVDIESYKRVTINATDVIGETLKRAFIDLSEAIKKFVSGEDLTRNLVNGITAVNSSFESFFGEIRNSAKRMLDELAKVAQTSFGFYNELSDKLKTSWLSPQNGQASERGNSDNVNGLNDRGRYEREFIINANISMGSNGSNMWYEIIKDVVTIDMELSTTLEQTNRHLSRIATKIQSGDLNKPADLTVNEEITRILTNNINRVFAENKVNIVNNVVQQVMFDARMVGAITEKLTDDSDFVEKIANHIIGKTSAVTQIVNNFTSSDTLVDKVTRATVYNDNFINRTTYMFINNPTVSSKLQENVANALSQNERTIEKVTRNVENNISQSITNHFISNVASLVTNVVNKLSVNETVLVNVRERIARVFTNERVVMAITERIINNPEHMKQFVIGITENQTINQTLITNVTNEIVKHFTENQEILNSINVNNNVKVDNRTSSAYNNEYKSSVVTFVDAEGEENTLELFDKSAHEHAMNSIRADMRALARETALNRQQINNNTVQVSKIAGVGSINIQQPEPLPVQPLYALSV